MIQDKKKKRRTTKKKAKRESLAKKPKTKRKLAAKEDTSNTHTIWMDLGHLGEYYDAKSAHDKRMS